MIQPKTVRYFLYNFQKLKDDIIDLEETIRSLNLCEPTMRIPCMADADGSQFVNGQHSQVEDEAIRNSERWLKYKRELAFKRRMLRAINCVFYYMQDDSVDWKIIKLRYIKKQKWSEIAKQLCYDQTYLQNRDLWIMQEIINNYGLRGKRY